ncbi:Acetyl esterase/lipase [Arachidicoccus rhizosphaerae]|uniref:Acetyl esterase/lipase n=1 Tax=Arachidicoccus rhizosphaerae TaxID=551991 RepID=A0A1H4AXG3_9BACT|nr:alpha/beta hydrolase [Arachidicoccus rhizosphaerae]SEA40589.1 Acetyl esterase/lipase [Arachidicoccus rhizosphaerae]
MKKPFPSPGTLSWILGLGLTLTSTLTSLNALKAQQVIPLYSNIPGSKADASYKEGSTTGKDGVIRLNKVTDPTLTVFKPTGPVNAHTAVIICPGGGYQILAFNLEGTAIAKRLAGWGITAFVLKYRLPSDQIMENKSIGPLMDAERAIALVRSEAAKWEVSPDQIGIMGFSAGGHLAASLSTLYHKDVLGSARPAVSSLRPDFSILAYPVISMQKEITHMGSRTALLGSNPDAALVDQFSLEKQVTDSTPKTFLVLASDDNGVPPANSLNYVTALLRHKVPVELHMYQNGGHGFGGHNKHTADDWMKRLQHWLQHNKLIAEDKKK